MTGKGGSRLLPPIFGGHKIIQAKRDFWRFGALWLCEPRESMEMGTSTLGILATIVGGIGMVFLGFVLGPIALIMGVIAVIAAYARRGTTADKVWGIIGLLTGFVACVTSPVLWVLLGLSVVTANLPEDRIIERTVVVTSPTVVEAPAAVSVTEAPAAEVSSSVAP